MSKQDIITAVQHVDKLLTIPALQGATVHLNKNGKPFFFTGGFTMVFQLVHKRKKWAFRVWHVPVKDMKDRFREISDHLNRKKLPYFAEFIYDEKGLIVNGEPQDTTRMEWVEGDRFKDYIGANVNNPAVLKRLAKAFTKMCSDLRTHGISHGDLQHGNILINSSGKIKLVDYDSICVPSLEGQSEMITGLKGYQHPSRARVNKASLKADYFSELVIYISLLAFIEKKSLWDDYQVSSSEYLLFTEDDFDDFENAKIYTDLKGLSREINGLLYILKQYLNEPSFLDLKPFTSYRQAPDITLFKGDRAAVVRGMTVTLSWKTTNADVVEIDNGVGEVDAEGSIDVLPAADTQYKITAKNHFDKRTGLCKVMVFQTPEIKNIAVPMPHISGKIYFNSLSVKPVTIDCSINIPDTNTNKPTISRPVNLFETLQIMTMSNQPVFSISEMMGRIKRKLISNK